MILSELDERSRYLAYALLVGRAASALRAYRAAGRLSGAQATKLEQVLVHLSHVERAEELITADPEGMIVPDLESMQVYACVAEALSATALLSDSVAPGEAVDAQCRVLTRILKGAGPDEVGEPALVDLLRLLDMIASLYNAGARQSSQPDYLETLIRWPPMTPHADLTLPFLPTYRER